MITITTSVLTVVVTVVVSTVTILNPVFHQEYKNFYLVQTKETETEYSELIFQMCVSIYML